MFVIDDIAMLAAAGLLTALIVASVAYIKNLFSGRDYIPGELPTNDEQLKELVDNCKNAMNDYEVSMIHATRDLIRSHFGTDIVKRISSESNDKNRINLFREFAYKLSKLYGVEIEVDCAILSNRRPPIAGFYSEDEGRNEKKLTFDYLCLLKQEQDEFSDDGIYRIVLMNIIDTIIHELRHGIQHESIRNDEFWQIDEERKIKWAWNVRHYIRPEVDPKGYTYQPLEVDARTFASMCLENVTMNGD